VAPLEEGPTQQIYSTLAWRMTSSSDDSNKCNWLLEKKNKNPQRRWKKKNKMAAKV